MSKFEFFIHVPLNTKGVEKLESDYEYFTDENIKTIVIDEIVYNYLFPLFNKFNKTFGIIIDEFEEDFITRENLDKAIEITQKFIVKESGTARLSAERFMEMLLLAKKNGTYVDLDF